jgi:hypothetical protein
MKWKSGCLMERSSSALTEQTPCEERFPEEMEMA